MQFHISILFCALAITTFVTGQDNITDISTEAPPTTASGQDPAVISGERARAGEIPYQAGLFRRNGMAYCGGSLIHPRIVLTAAHCVPEDGYTQVRLGDVNWHNMPHRQVVDRFIIHQNYDFVGKTTNDVALMRLPQAAPIGSNIGLVALAPSNLAVLGGVPVRGSGFGQMANNVPIPSENLLKVNLVTVTNDDCRRSAQLLWNLVKPDNLCARYSTTPQQAVCHGDSGGPLVINHQGQDIQVGIVSFGLPMACNTGPQVFARVSSFRNWIDTETARAL